MEQFGVKEQNEEKVYAKEGKFLSFFLGKEEYAIEILRVQEIIGLMAITPTAKLPEYFRGIVNLRGQVIPIMNLRTRFKLPEVEDTVETCVIVVVHKDQQFGLIVDKVSEVADIKANQFEALPQYGNVVDTKFLDGLAKTGKGVKMLVNITNVLSGVSNNLPL